MGGSRVQVVGVNGMLMYGLVGSGSFRDASL